MANAVSQAGYSILVKNVTKKELEDYQKWVDEQRWGGNMGNSLFPAKAPDKATMHISSGFGHTWFADIVPSLTEYWGEARIVHEVAFEEK